MAVLSQAVEAFSVGMALPAEQVFVHARRLREADETLIPRDPVGRNKGVPLLPSHLFNLMVSVASSDPIAQASRLVRAWRAAHFVPPMDALVQRDAAGRFVVPEGRISEMARHTLSGDMELIIDLLAKPSAKEQRLRERLDQDFWLTLTVGEALLATVNRTGGPVDEYDARDYVEEPRPTPLFRVHGREREIRIEPLRRTAQLTFSHFQIAGELWADSMAHGAAWQPTESPSGGSERETAAS
jgi:hypothetical protein